MDLAVHKLSFVDPHRELWPEELVARGVSPFHESSPVAAAEIVRHTDYFRYPGVQHFASVGQLVQRLAELSVGELEDISRKMERFNKKSLAQSVARWGEIL